MSDIDALEATITEVEGRLGIRSGFFADLAREDDWSFVVKAHALLESSCSAFLTDYLGRPELADIFVRLELSSKDTGKVAFAKAFGLMNDRERRFISALSQLRNLLVHNVKNTTFSFAEHVGTLDANQRKSFVESLGYAYLSEEDGKEFIAYQERVLSRPKETILLGLKYVIGIMGIQVDTAALRRDVERYQAQIGMLKASMP
ncbi:hypothetical protein [Lysobacter sp. HA35]